ncbi:MAG TPA: hypothetical protein VLU95_08315 [Candidatus Acidoferrum sp.]|nr:hypothetical protein [Candidatus Acidoferrum sp.]
MDIQSIRFHFERGDFQKWLRTTIGDEELAWRIDNLDKTAPDELIICHQKNALAHSEGREN